MRNRASEIGRVNGPLEILRFKPIRCVHSYDVCEAFLNDVYTGAKIALS
jgi:hypothetical protein